MASCAVASLCRRVATSALLPRTCARALATTAGPSSSPGGGDALSPPRRIKHKAPRKKATSMLAELRNIEMEKAVQMNAEKNIPPFNPGDAIEVKVVTHLTSEEVETYRGVVLGIKRMGADTRFKMADVFMGMPLLNEYPLYSPFIKSIKVLQPAHIYEGTRRVRRAKLYYLWEKRDPKEYTITG